MKSDGVKRGQIKYGNSNFDESKHPRAKDGKFGKGSGSSKLSEEVKKVKPVKTDEGFSISSEYGNGTVVGTTYEEMIEYDSSLENFVADRPYKIEHLESLVSGIGAGTEILKKLEDAAIADGADAFYLNASPMGFNAMKDLEKLVNFYEDRGYEAIKDEGTNVIMFKSVVREKK